jgi:hypothetical protein
VPEAPDECQALRAVNTQSVVLVDCELQGGSGSATWPPAFPGLEANDSRVSLFGCQVTGGESAVDSRDFPGNAAVDATGGVIYAAGCALSGGEDPELDTSPGILADGSALALLASTFPGTGPTVVQQGGELLELDGTPRTFDVSSPVRERQPLGISASGEPGEAVWLAVDVKALFLLAPVHAAPLLVDASLLLVPVGTIGLDGQLALSVPAPQLPSSWEGATIFMQALFVAPPDPVLLSNPDALVLLDESL